MRKYWRGKILAKLAHNAQNFPCRYLLINAVKLLETYHQICQNIPHYLLPHYLLHINSNSPKFLTHFPYRMGSKFRRVQTFVDFVVACSPRNENMMTSLHKVQNSTDPQKYKPTNSSCFGYLHHFKPSKLTTLMVLQ